MSKSKVITYIAALFIACLFAPARAAEPPTKRVNYADQKIISVFKAAGYRAERLVDGVIFIKIDGDNFVVLNRADGNLMAEYNIYGVRVDLKVLNEWNGGEQISRAFVAHDDTVLRAILLSGGGLSNEVMVNFIDNFRRSVKNSGSTFQFPKGKDGRYEI